MVEEEEEEDDEAVQIQWSTERRFVVGRKRVRTAVVFGCWLDSGRWVDQA